MKFIYFTFATTFSLSLSLLVSSPATAQDILPDFSTERIGDERDERRPPSTQRRLIPAGLLFASFDTDADYATSRTELETGISRSFANADSNKNNRLSLVELAAWREAVLGSRDVLPGNTQFDKNFDSQIEADEFALTLTDLFEGFDENKNGQLEFKEMTRDMPQRREEKTRPRERISPLGERGQRRFRFY